MKTKTLFLTDLLLLICIIPTSVTGFILHWAAHQADHTLWHNWAVAHVLSTLLFTIIVAVHIYGHWGWYKSLVKNGAKNKSRITILLTILILSVIVTGYTVLIRHQGANSHFGLWHYVLGIALTIVAIGHLIKRHKVLSKGLKSK